MRNKLNTGIAILIILLSGSTLVAQNTEWKKKTTKDGKVTVSYKFTEYVNEDGKKYNVLEYEAVTVAAVSLERCKSVMEEDSKHREFMDGTRETRRIRDLSDGEWLSYYYLNSRWPMPDADIVTRYTVEEAPSGEGFILTGTPAPEMYPEQDVPRMKQNHSKYTFTNLGRGQTEITMWSRSIPVVSVPKWLVAAWIPNGPADMLNGIIRLAGE